MCRGTHFAEIIGFNGFQHIVSITKFRGMINMIGIGTNEGTSNINSVIPIDEAMEGGRGIDVTSIKNNPDNIAVPVHTGRQGNGKVKRLQPLL